MIVAGTPGRIIDGETDDIVGTRLVTLKMAGSETPPPGKKFCAVIVACELPVK